MIQFGVYISYKRYEIFFKNKSYCCQSYIMLKDWSIGRAKVLIFQDKGVDVASGGIKRTFD